MLFRSLDTSSFVFIGFLPLNKKLRKEKLSEIEKIDKTCILYEAPHKLKNTLLDLKEVISNRQIVLAREITKIHEEFIRKDIDKLIEISDSLKGEFVIIIEGKEKVEEENELNKLSLDEHYKFYEKQGLSKKEIIKRIAKDRNVNKNEIYKEFI